MNKETVTTIVIQAICEIQEMGGQPVDQIGLDTCPIGGLEGFDSLNSLEATCLISERLGFDVDTRLFIPSGNGDPISIKAVVDRICELPSQKP
jgi:hypothetical protein